MKYNPNHHLYISLLLIMQVEKRIRSEDASYGAALLTSLKAKR